MSVQERLMQFLNHKRLSKLAFANSIGRSPTYVTNIVEGIGRASQRVIEQTYPELNMEWLRTGEGEMLNPITANIPTVNGLSEADMVLVIPVSAQAGRLTDFVASVCESDCEKMISPIKGAEYAVSVTGDSMSPEYPNGSKVLIAKINHRAFIDWGRTYVLDTCNGVVIKKVFPGESKDSIKCVSVNPNYPSFEVKAEDVYGWYRVLMSLALK